MTALKLGVSLPIITKPEDLARVGGIGAAARHVERLGLESAWAADMVLGSGNHALDAPIVLAAAAAATERIRLGFGTYTLALRPAAASAAMLASLQQVSGDRILLGVGSGGFPSAPIWPAVGIPATERGRRTNAILEVLPDLIAGKPTRIGPDSPEMTLAPASTVPTILIGGTDAAPTLRRTLAYADEWFPSSMPSTVIRGAAKLREMSAEQGRPMPLITVGGPAVLAGADIPVEAMTDRLVQAYGIAPDEAPKIPLTGGPAQIADRLAAFAEAGAHRVVMGLASGDWLRQAEQLAEGYALLS
ncbi:LLM class flavin-dependent oxidoreductase [Fodinicola feengrottensis]|uniref:LLM class flavin-dependent oxidoreductase n=1 Tax=Fodinicola feengrottensis TaxID=435914 RepID=UPI0013CFD2A0|nr:LLM class flavin-dependent oxidoreductase [Fodinicola feengrottensis]